MRAPSTSTTPETQRPMPACTSTTCAAIRECGRRGISRVPPRGSANQHPKSLECPYSTPPTKRPQPAKAGSERGGNSPDRRPPEWRQCSSRRPTRHAINNADGVLQSNSAATSAAGHPGLPPTAACSTALPSAIATWFRRGLVDRRRSHRGCCRGIRRGCGDG